MSVTLDIGRGVRLALALGSVALAPGIATANEPDTERTVVAVLVDGLSGAMIDRFDTPALDRLRAEGAWSHELAPTFPAISGPTWVSLSTGCWPAHHGVVTDKFWDPELGLMDHSGDPKWLTGCELLQQVAERQGVTTAALGWWGQWSADTGPTATYVSANAEVEQQVPRDPLAYLPDRERIAEIVGHLNQAPKAWPRLILAYLPGPDHDAHFHGLFSPENAAAVRRTDEAIGELLEAVETHPDRERIAVLVFSDHGMVPANRIVNLRRILRRHGIEVRDVTTGTSGFLYFEDDVAARRAHDALSAYEEFDVFLKDDLPDYMALGEGPRVPALLLAAKPGYYTADPDLWPWYLRLLTMVGPDFIETPLLGAGIVAAHGYTPETPGNDGVFYAWGSGVAPDVALGTTRMIDVHPTITHLLGIEPGSTVDGVAMEALLTGQRAAAVRQGATDEPALRPVP